MKLYLDTSALTKLVATERESAALRTYLQAHGADTRFTAALTHTELLRAVSRRGPAAAIEHARRLLTRLDIVALTTRLLDVAAVLPPAQLRTLDAIHLAAALTAPDLRALVTYDVRMAHAAGSAGIAVAQPT